MTEDPSHKPVSRRRATAAHAVGGYARTAISVVQGLILIPLYLHYIGAQVYGLWLATGGILAWLGAMNMGVGAVFVQRIAHAYGNRDMTRVGVHFTNGMLIYAALSLLFVAIGGLVAPWVPVVVNAGGHAELLKNCFLVAVLAAGLNIVNECLMAFTQAILRPVATMVFLIAAQLLGLAVTITLLFQDVGLWSIPVGMLTAAITAFLLNVMNVLQLFHSLGLKAAFSLEVLRDYIHTSPALFAGRMGSALVQEVEPLLITIAMVPEIAAAYAIMKRAAEIVARLLTVIIVSVGPSYSHLAGEMGQSEAARYARIILSLVFGLGLAGFGLYVALNKAFVTLWVGPEYFLNQKVVLFIAAGALAMALRNTAYRLLIGLGDIVKPSLFMLAEAILRIALMYLLLIFVGVEGLPAALMLSCMVFFVMLLRRLGLRISFGYSARNLIHAGAVTLIVFALSLASARFVPTPDGWPMFLAVALIMASLSLVLVGSVNEFLRMSFRSALMRSRR